jgi:hypothetical protein
MAIYYVINGRLLDSVTGEREYRVETAEGMVLEIGTPQTLIIIPKENRLMTLGETAFLTPEAAEVGRLTHFQENRRRIGLA